MLEQRFPELLKLSNYQRRPSLYLASDEAAVAVLRAELDGASRASGSTASGWTARSWNALWLPAAGGDPVRARRRDRSGAFHAGRHGRSPSVTACGCSRAPGSSHIEPRGAAPAPDDRRRCIRSMPRTWWWRRDSSRWISCRARWPTSTIPMRWSPSRWPIPGASHAMPLIWESARPYVYLRSTPDGRLHGGRRRCALPQPGGTRRCCCRASCGGSRPTTRSCLARICRRLPMPGVGASPRRATGCPSSAAVPGMHPRLLFALCFGGNGITYSAHAGDMIRAAIEGRVPRTR